MVSKFWCLAALWNQALKEYRLLTQKGYCTKNCCRTESKLKIKICTQFVYFSNIKCWGIVIKLKKNPRTPDLSVHKFTGPTLQPLASGLRSSVKFKPCKLPWMYSTPSSERVKQHDCIYITCWIYWLHWIDMVFWL